MSQVSLYLKMIQPPVRPVAFFLMSVAPICKIDPFAITPLYIGLTPEAIIGFCVSIFSFLVLTVMMRERKTYFSKKKKSVTFKIV